ncbi:MAG TPA: hypothetical protein VG753_03080 [Candidatus Paceibacterota bacterium]|nr:hypothetical protein [Candidatus Paceibacterota bacterium]
MKILNDKGLRAIAAAFSLASTVFVGAGIASADKLKTAAPAWAPIPHLRPTIAPQYKEADQKALDQLFLQILRDEQGDPLHKKSV